MYVFVGRIRGLKYVAESPRPSLENAEAAPGFEPGMEVLQTSALPLGYAANAASTILWRINNMEGCAYSKRVTGLEPATPTLARLCSTN
jgi:hypothetical protein